MRAQIAPHAERLERWLGAAEVHNLSVNFRDWPGPPVAVAGVPGRVFVTGGGDFIGECRAGAELSAVERAMDMLREARRARFRLAFWRERGSFSSISALVTAATAGKAVRMSFNKVGTAPTAILGAMDTWMYGPAPVAGAAGGAIATAPTICTAATGGALAFVNAVVNANTSHFVNAWVTANYINSLLLVDQLYRGAEADFFEGNDAAFVAHKQVLRQQLDSVAQTIENNAFAKTGFGKITLRRSRWAKTHRPIRALFPPERTKSVGGTDLGEFIVELRALRSQRTEHKTCHRIAGYKPSFRSTPPGRHSPLQPLPQCWWLHRRSPGRTATRSRPTPSMKAIFCVYGRPASYRSPLPRQELFASIFVSVRRLFSIAPRSCWRRPQLRRVTRGG
jgi:hypothetical protein